MYSIVMIFKTTAYILAHATTKALDKKATRITYINYILKVKHAQT